MSFSLIRIPTTASGIPGGGTVLAAQNGTSLANPTTVVFGGDVGTSVGQLLSNREIPFNSQSILFSGMGAVAGSHMAYILERMRTLILFMNRIWYFKIVRVLY